MIRRSLVSLLPLGGTNRVRLMATRAIQILESCRKILTETVDARTLVSPLACEADCNGLDYSAK